MSVDLNALDSKPFNDGVDVANLPAQMGAFDPPPQPGPFRFRLPKTLSMSNFNIIEESKTEGQGQRLNVQFNDAAPLLVVQAHALEAERVGTPFKTLISNFARKRGKRDDPNAPKAADWDYLNVALGRTIRPVGNRGYAEAILADAAAEKEFTADAELSWNCNENRTGRWADGQGGTQELETAPGVKKMGCGERYYQNDLEKVNGKFPVTITCAKCQAQVRAFANLVRFRP
jgi:hypothetical protein